MLHGRLQWTASRNYTNRNYQNAFPLSASHCYVVSLQNPRHKRVLEMGNRNWERTITMLISARKWLFGSDI